MMQPNQKLHGLAGLTLCLGLVSATVFKPLLEQATAVTASIQDNRLTNMHLNEYKVTHNQTIPGLIGATLTSSQLETLRSSVVFHGSDHFLMETEARSMKPCNIVAVDTGW